jgi:hypothetical protein
MTFSEDTYSLYHMLFLWERRHYVLIYTRTYVDIVICRNLHQSLECLDQRIKDIISKEKEQGTGNYKVCYLLYMYCMLFFRVSDPYSFDTDPDPDPEFRLNTDPDPIRTPGGFWWPKIEKDLQLKKNWSKTSYLSLGLHKGRPSYRRSLQLSKENIQHFKT